MKQRLSKPRASKDEFAAGLRAWEFLGRDPGGRDLFMRARRFPALFAQFTFAKLPVSVVQALAWFWRKRDRDDRQYSWGERCDLCTAGVDDQFADGCWQVVADCDSRGDSGRPAGGISLCASAAAGISARRSVPAGCCPQTAGCDSAAAVFHAGGQHAGRRLRHSVAEHC